MFFMRFSRWHDNKSLTYVKLFKTLIIYAQGETVVTRLNVYWMLASYFLTFFAPVEVMESVTVW